MLRYLILISCFSVVLSFNLVDLNISKFYPLGIVENATQCGGDGELEQVRVTGCTAEPCQIYPDLEYLFEFDFAAGTIWHDFLNLNVSLILEGSTDEIPWFEQIFDNPILPGQRYTASWILYVSTQDYHGDIIFKTVLYNDVHTNIIELCNQIKAHIHD